MSDFVHLHLHSEYSLLDGACKISEIPMAVKSMGQSAVAITDHGVMYGVPKFYKECLKEGIKPIIGCEVYVSDANDSDITADNNIYSSLILLCMNDIGYKNLSYIVSESFVNEANTKPHTDIKIISEHAEGLICLSGGFSGKIDRLILNNNIRGAADYALELKEIFSDECFYLEVQNQGINGQNEINNELVKISEKYNIPLVATNDVHYISKEDAFIQSVLYSIKKGQKLSDKGYLYNGTDAYYLKSADEMQLLLGKYKAALSNTKKIADMCNFTFNFGKPILPDFPIDNGMTPGKYLEKLAKEGLENKISDGSIKFDDINTKDIYKSRMIYELLVIGKMKYEQYYLVVWDFVKYAKDNNIPVGPGRGSGAGSLVAYLIGITEIDSVKYNLLFERFLNPQRISMPDFDIDFCYNRREEVIKYVEKKYGKDHTSQIVTFGTLSPKAAIRDVGRILDISNDYVDKIARLIPGGNDISLKDLLKRESTLGDIYRNDSNAKKLIDICIRIEGMPRHVSVHAAGIVIAKDPVYTYLPVSRQGSTVITQYDMDTVAEIGLLKFDFLALRYLTVISDAEREIKKSNSDFNISKIPPDDLGTYRTLASGQTAGLFQLESAGMRQLLMKLKPTCLEDIMVAIALYRPGPIDSISKFLENRRAPNKITYKINQLEEILGPTYGCIIYQEQVMQICRKIANFSYGHADIVRKAMAKKNSELLEQERTAFLEGAKANFINKQCANELFDEMSEFAKYAFNKSHAAAYSVITYRTSYLKTNYPAEYFAALLNSVVGDSAKTSAYISECHTMNIEVLPPDINFSEILFTVENGKIRFGLSSIRAVGEAFAKKIIDERSKEKFSSYDNFCQRMIKVELTAIQAQALVSVGCFDNLGLSRGTLISAYEKILSSYQNFYKHSVDGQIDIFSDRSTENKTSFNYEIKQDLSNIEKLNLEKNYLGTYLSKTPLDNYQKIINNLCAVSIAQINDSFNRDFDYSESVSDKQQVVVACILSKITERKTKSGENIYILHVEDNTGEIDILAFSKSFPSINTNIKTGTALAINGNISVRENENPKIIATDISLLESLDKSYNSKSDNVKNNSVNEKNNEFTKLYIRIDMVNSKMYDKVMNILDIFAKNDSDSNKYTAGYVKTFIFDQSEKKYIPYKDNPVYVDDYVIKELSAICGGSENVVSK